MKHLSVLVVSLRSLALLLCAITSLRAAAPVDENFEDNAADGASVATPRTLDGFVFDANGGASTYITDSGGFGITVGSGNIIVVNADASSSVTYFEIRSSSLSDKFKLVSLMIESFGGSSSIGFTVTGYNGGSGTTAVASDTINLTASDSSGSISYAKNPAVDGGTLTFDSTWGNIDTIRFTKNDANQGPYLSLDNIDISAAVSTPAITSATYDAATGALVVTGTDFTATGGATNDIVANKFTFTGQGGGTHTLTDTSNTEISSATAFTLTLSATDKTAVNLLLNKNGTSSLGGTTYNLAGAAGFVAASAGTADTTGNGITVSNAVPTVTNANISISGASGTGGAYKIGDTVTATWNNTAGGDNNAGTISSVTVNFSAFGGGAAVAATNSSSTWTATYTITAGAVDATNRNVSVTATDTNALSTTTADTTNATVDSVAPTVTDANLSISGATGTGGAYKIGDTVTATWNNTAGGDNNSDTISSVTVDFSQFGGGSAVAASNSSGTWTATYTIVGGAISATNRNVSVTATDNAGNTTTTADTTNATVDNQAPTATIATAAFSADAGNSSSDFITSTAAQTVSGTLSANMVSGEIVEVSLDNGSSWSTATTTVGVNTWSLTGQTLAASNTLRVRVADTAGNVGTALAQAYVLDTTAPTVTSVSVPANATYVSGQNLDFTVNLTESVTVSTAGGTPAMALTVGATARSATCISGSGTSALTFRYTVQANDLDANGIAVGALSLESGSIQDTAGNDATLTLNSVGSTANVLVDAVAPTVSSSTVPADGTYRAGQNLDFTVTYSENVTVSTGGGTPYVSVTLSTGGSVQAAYTSGTGTSTVTFRYTVAAGNADADGLAVASAITLNGGTIRDGSDNNAATTSLGFGSTTGVLVDAIAPTISFINRHTPSGATTSGPSVVYRVTFSETVTGVDTSDFLLTSTGSASGSIASVSAVSGSVYDITVDTISGNGTLRLDLKNSGTGITDTPGTSIATGYTSGQTYTIDTTAPAVSTILRQSPTSLLTTATSLTWQVTFNENVTGVDAADFTLTAVDGTASGTVGTVTPVSGTVYDVTATGVAGLGALRLDLKASGTAITDTPGNPIATGFTTGAPYRVGAESVFDALGLSLAANVTTSLASSNRPAQRFTTAASGPLALSSVTVAVGSVTATPSPVVTINADNAGAPGTVVATLTNPASLIANTLNTWTTSTLLNASTTYWIVFAEATSSYVIDVSVQTTGGTGTWLNAPDYFFRYGSNSGTTQTGALLLALGAVSPPAITSSLTASATSGSAFTYTITATQSPTSFAATGLPTGLTLNTSTGAITGTPTPSGSFNVSLTATNAGGTSTPATLVLTVAAPPTPPAPVVTTATVTLGDTVQTYDGGPKAATVTTSPLGLQVTVTYDGSTTPPTAAGSYAVAATVNQSGFSGTANGTLTIAKAAQTLAFAPVGTATVGSSVTLSATASSGLPVTFSVVSGNATLTGAALKFNDNSPVTVRAAQAGNANFDSVNAEQSISASGQLAQTISFAALSDKITSDGAFTLAATASSGLPVSFTASGPVTLSGNTVTLTGTPGSVTVTATQGGNATYLPAPAVARTFTVSSASSRIFIGEVVSSNGATRLGDLGAVLPPTGNEGHLVIVAPTVNIELVLDFVLLPDGTFVKVIVDDRGIAAPSEANIPTIAAAPRTLTVRGRYTGNLLTGTIDEVGLRFTVPVQGPGPTASAAGFYPSSTLNSATGSTYTVVGQNGEVVVLAVTGDTSFGGLTTLNADGTFALNSTAASIAGAIDTTTTTVSGTLSQPGQSTLRFAGAAATTVRTDRLINLSSRNRVGSGSRALITGFVISGTESKRILLRAAGPALSAFGVSTALRNPRLQLFRDGQLVQENDDWRQAANATDVATTATRSGAFPFANDSRDAALLVTLSAGAYTALVVDDTGEGVGLAEIYDASETASTGITPRLVNLSTRGESGSGENVLIGGIVVTGNAPKRLLIRGIGPGLAAFGVTGALTDSSLKLYDSAATLIAQNDNWETPQPLTASQVSATATDLVAATRQAAAFALSPGSRDAALIVILGPGSYTAHVSGTAGQTGVALIEVYELPE